MMRVRLAGAGINGTASPSEVSRSRTATRVRSLFFLWFLVGLLPWQPPNGIGSTIFDLAFLVTSILLAFEPGRDRKALLVGAICTVYVLVDWVFYLFLHHPGGLALSTGATEDFLLSDKYIVYLVLMTPFVGVRKFDEAFFKTVFQAMLLAALIKYTYVRVLHLGNRPKLLIENNYELIWLILLLLMYGIYRNRAGKGVPVILFGLTALTILISGSRSAALALVPVTIFLYARLSVKSAIALMILAPFSLFSAAYVFVERLQHGGIARIDRVRFFEVFLHEVHGFSFINFVVGKIPLAPLSSWACGELAFYQNLFSAEGSGRCYAVVFHAFFMRAFYNHGAAGVLLPFLIIDYFLRRSGFRLIERVCFLTVGSVCSLSVSGLGTSFVAFPLAMAMGWSPSRVLRRPTARSRADAGSVNNPALLKNDPFPDMAKIRESG